MMKYFSMIKYMKRHAIHVGRTLLMAIVLSFPTMGHAQMDSLLFEDSHAMDSVGKGELRLNIDGLSFFRDNEYEGNLRKGYTLPGFWLQPTVSFQPLKNLRLEAGAFMLHYWGANKYPNLNYSDIPKWKGDQTQSGFHIVPFFQVQLALTPRFHLIIGNLYGKNNHHLIEPLYNQEIGLSGDPETGLQVLWNAPVMDLDTWINWESFIFENDKHQESFTFGLSSRFKANAPTKRLHVYFPVQVVMQHRGGEINPEAESREIKTWMNGAAGIGLTLHPRNELLRSINIEGTAAYYKQMAGKMLPFDKGHGFFAKTDIDLWRFRIHGAYWACKDFISILGNPLFGAMGISEEDYKVDSPKMLSARISYGHDLGYGFSWGIHGDVYNNLAVDAYSSEKGWYRESKAMSLAMGIYIRFNPSYLLKRF